MRLALVSADDGPCRPLAERLSQSADLEILCVSGTGAGRWLDPGTWHPGGITTIRFRADYPAVPELERRLADVVRAGEAAAPLEQRWLEERGPYSSALLRALDERRMAHDVFVFFGLESAVTVMGLPRVDGPTVLVPAISDWSLAGSRVLRETLAAAGGIVFATEEERRRLLPLVGPERPVALAVGSSPEPYLEVVRRVRAVVGDRG